MAKKVAESLIWSRAVKVAAMKVKTKSSRSLQRALESHDFTLADAYEVGVQEAQQEIVRRLSLVANKLWERTNTADLKERTALGE
jgi:hypothetical protein